MHRWSNAPAVLLVAAMVLALAHNSQASNAPKWSDEQLSAFSDAIVMGRVVDLATGWDPAVDTIYTYVTVEVSEVLKGNLSPGRITIKQLGGEVGELGLSIIDQASFRRGEDVLLFLETRPRDRSLYTVALWQGKWNIERAANGGRMAVRREPGSAAADFRSVDSLRVSANAVAAFGRGAATLNTSPVDSLAATPQEYVLMDIPYRYSFSPAVDVEAAGQPGLAGGGFSEIVASVNRWNGAGSTFTFAGGTTTSARCTTQILNNRRVTISFMDPCGEISNTGGTLALGGSYYETTGGSTVNGQFFRNAVEGFIVNNDSTTAQNFLRQSGCFADIQLHELGHVLGLGHSSDSNAIMFATINNGCTSGAHGLGVDDIQGLLFIYPSSTPPPPTSVPNPVTGLTATVSGNNVTLRWNASAGATSYRVFATVGGATVFDGNVGNTTVVSATAPNGTYTVTVFAVNSAGQSAGASTTFVVGGPVSPPTAPATVTAILGANRTVTVSWSAGAGATSYRLLAVLNGAVVFNSNVGATTSVGPVQVPPGNYTVTIFSVNAAGESATGTSTPFVVP